MFPLQGNQPDDTLYVDDVFSTYLYTGNGSTQTINNGIDLAGEGGLVWHKTRNISSGNWLVDTVRGANNRLIADGTNASANAGDSIYNFSSSGFSVSTAASTAINGSGNSCATWTFRKAPKFFDVQTATLSSGNATVSFSGLSTLGMVIVKRTDSTGDWYVWHRSLTAGKLLYLNQTAAEATLGHITVSGTTLTLVDGTLADGNYVCYGFAHDTSADGIIQCGSFTNGNIVNLGWEPQYVLIKCTNTTRDWFVYDAMRGFNVTANKALKPNTADAEIDSTLITPTSTGFDTSGIATGTYIYLAIRRPNKPPTSGTQVYASASATGATTKPAWISGFPVDMAIKTNDNNSVANHNLVSRLTGVGRTLYTDSTSEETAYNDSGNYSAFDYMNGFGKATFTLPVFHAMFRRAPGVFETFCDTGTGANKTEAHGLAAIPELWLRKGRSGATQWVWGSSLIANTEKIVMPSPNGVVTDATAWNSTYPTATQFSVGTAAAVNASSATYVTYLWASKPGISKVFTYTGDGGSGKVIDCGFTAGARFILIIRTTASTAQDIFIWDSARGIIAGNDPHLSLNSTAAEVTTDDSVDPDNSGFAINQVAATNINVNGAVYIGLAYA